MESLSGNLCCSPSATSHASSSDVLSALLRVIPSSVPLVVSSTLQRMMCDERFNDGVNMCVCGCACLVPCALCLVPCTFGFWLSVPDSHLRYLPIIKSPNWAYHQRRLSPTQAWLSVLCTIQVRLCICSMFDTHPHKCLPVLRTYWVHFFSKHVCADYRHLNSGTAVANYMNTGTLCAALVMSIIDV